ncbi:MAG: rhodanese-like domain-containing protein [Deltaproteobacteria bacterium]|nr:rhodanese-like domain-containing protein [Deltaproteobacteria bacterium]
MGWSARWLVVAGLALVPVSAACDARSGEAAGAAGSAARAAVESGALLLDVRTPGEFASGHIDGAVNIPVDALADRAGEIEAGRQVVVYCRSGRRSATAAELLRARGHQVIDIGPMGAW